MLGKLPEELEELPEEQLELFLTFMRTERDSAKLRGLQAQFYR